MSAGVARLLTRLRWMSVVDAVTYVLLVGVAMPLKYAAGFPQAVTAVGMVHGVVWMLFMALLVRARFEAGWPNARLWLLGCAALVPVAPLLLDRRVRSWIEADSAGER